MSVIGFVDPEILIVFRDHQLTNGLYPQKERVLELHQFILLLVV